MKMKINERILKERINQFSKDELERIEQKANNITNKYVNLCEDGNLSLDKGNGYIDIVQVSKDLGFLIANAELKVDSDGFIIIDEKADSILGFPTNKIIGVNKKLSLEWKRFTIAHEIGHYILHYVDHSLNWGGLYARREHIKGKNKEENAADYFAACLLMPAQLFTEKFRQIQEAHASMSKGEIADQLSRDFLVTQTMSIRRIDELGLM